MLTTGLFLFPTTFGHIRSPHIYHIYYNYNNYNYYYYYIHFIIINWLQLSSLLPQPQKPLATNCWPLLATARRQHHSEIKTDIQLAKILCCLTTGLFLFPATAPLSHFCAKKALCSSRYWVGRRLFAYIHVLLLMFIYYLWCNIVWDFVYGLFALPTVYIIWFKLNKV